MRHPQRSFRFSAAVRPSLKSFIAGANDELVTRLRGLSSVDTFVGLWLYAGDSTGKSHLLQAVSTPAGYFARPPAAASAQAADARGLVAIDEVERWCGDRHLEEQLMGLYQGLLASGGKLLLSSRLPPRALTPLLPDLASRMRSFEAYELLAPDDDGKRLILERQTRRRGLNLAPEVLDFWLSRSGRSLRSLLEELELVIDHALGSQRALTVPLLKEALHL